MVSFQIHVGPNLLNLACLYWTNSGWILIVWQILETSQVCTVWHWFTDLSYCSAYYCLAAVLCPHRNSWLDAAILSQANKPVSSSLYLGTVWKKVKKNQRKPIIINITKSALSITIQVFERTPSAVQAAVHPLLVTEITELLNSVFQSVKEEEWKLFFKNTTHWIQSSNWMIGAISGLNGKHSPTYVS